MTIDKTFSVDSWISEHSYVLDMETGVEPQDVRKLAAMYRQRIGSLEADLAKATAAGMELARAACETRMRSHEAAGAWLFAQEARECIGAIRSKALRLQPPTPLPESAKENKNELPAA